MKLVSWCKPPLKEEYDIPDIPQYIKIFGVEYKQKQDMQTKDEIRQSVKLLVRQSFDKYLSLLDKPTQETVEEIEMIHLQINEMLNKHKAYEVEDQYRQIMTGTKKIKEEILTHLRDMTRPDKK